MGKSSREKKERKDKIERGEIVKPEKPETGIVSICKTLIFIGTGLALFTPLLVNSKFFFPFVGPKSIYFMGLVEIIFAVWLILLIFSKKYRPKFNALLAALVLFVSVLILSAVLGEDFSRSFWSKYERMTGLLMSFHLLAFFLVISSTFRKKADWFKIFSISIFVAVVTSIISLSAKAGIDVMGKAFPMRGGATIGNSSFLATYLLFNVFLALYLFLKTKAGFKVFAGISLGITTIALLLSTGRAAILSFLGGLVLLFLFWLIFCNKEKIRFAGIFFLAIFTFGALGVMYFSLQPDSFVYQKMVQMATQSRIVVWQAGWNGFLDRPWLGWGPENFELAFTKYFNPHLFLPEYGGEIWFDRAHNIVVDTLVATGIVGLLSYLGIFLASFYALWKRYFQQKADFWLAGIFSVILISYSVQNLTVFDMVNSYLMLFLVLGFIASQKDVSQNYESGSRDYAGHGVFLKKALTGIVLITFSFSFFVFVIQPLRTDAYAIKAIREQSPQERISLYEKTLSISQTGKYQLREFFSDSAINFFLSAGGEKIPKEDVAEEFDFISKELEKSIQSSPLDFRACLKLGRLYSIWANFDLSKSSQAEEVLNRAMEISQDNQQVYWFLAQAKVNQKDYQEALSLAEKAIELEPKLLQSHKIMIQIAMLSGDIEKTKELAQKGLEAARERINSFPQKLDYHKDAIMFAEILGNKEIAKKLAQEAVEINSAWASEFKNILEEPEEQTEE